MEVDFCYVGVKEMSEINVTRFVDVKKAMLQLLRDRSLIPVLGAGFSCGSKAYNGVVPSGATMKDYMLECIDKKGVYEGNEINKLRNKKFSSIAQIYIKHEDDNKRKDYYRDNFSCVILHDTKKRFLNINWRYIYTLNIDDAVENNSMFKHIISIYENVDDNIYDTKQCVIKLHGDVNDYLTYKDKKMILSHDEYVRSLYKNNSLLKRLEYDYKYGNLLYIGCSLEDELDIESVSINAEHGEDIDSNNYFCTIKSPTDMELDVLEGYGITHVVVFDNFDDIYTGMYNLWCESKKVQVDDLESCQKGSSIILPDTSFDKNSKYLFEGKSIFDADRNILLPYFFIERNIIRELLNSLRNKTFTLVTGAGFSGKSYALASVAYNIRSKSVYIFTSKEQINDEAFKDLLSKKDCIVLVDANAFTINQTMYILTHIRDIDEQNIHMMMFNDIRENDLITRINVLRNSESFPKEYFSFDFKIRNIFSANEVKAINKKLAECNLGSFEITKGTPKTLLDNVLRISKILNVKSCCYADKKPDFSARENIAACIFLAIREKITPYECIKYNMLDVVYKSQMVLSPLVDREYTYAFERRNSDPSEFKFVLNASIWLLEHLRSYADSGHVNEICDAYKFLFTNILSSINKQCDRCKNNVYRDIVKFDNINYIFGQNGKQGINLIREIYDSLNRLLAEEPSYKHQKAKCYIRCATYEEGKYKDALLIKAKLFIDNAIMTYENLVREKYNQKIYISYSHALYTKAVILCHICDSSKYVDFDMNKNAIEAVYVAYKEKYNTFAYVHKHDRTYGNVISKAIKLMVVNANAYGKDIKEKLQYLFKEMIQCN